MNVRLKKYFRFWFWIDLVGLGISLVFIISYLCCSCMFDERVQNLWSNLSIEMLGVWISVRVIDYLLQRNRQFRDTRLQQLSILQYFYETAINVLEYHSTYQRDVEKLNDEIRFFDKRWSKRSRHFYKDEKEQIRALRNSMPGIIEISTAVKRTSDAEQWLENKELKEKLKVLLDLYSKRLEKLRENIWEESHPDD